MPPTKLLDDRTTEIGSDEVATLPKVSSTLTLIDALLPAVIEVAGWAVMAILLGAAAEFCSEKVTGVATLVSLATTENDPAAYRPEDDQRDHQADLHQQGSPVHGVEKGVDASHLAHGLNRPCCDDDDDG